MTAIRQTLRTKDRYSVQDIIDVLSARGIKTTRRDVIRVIASIVDQYNKGVSKTKHE